MTAEPQAALAADQLGVLADAHSRAPETLALAARHLDPSLVDMLGILGFDKGYVSAAGSYLYDGDGQAYLDFHTGEGFASLGHNHPDVREVLQATLAAGLVDGVQIHYSVLAGMLAEALCELLPGRLEAAFFTSAGSEAVDAAMKFARAATGRPRLLSCQSSFHGVTLGPLSLVGDEFFKEGFGPLLPGCASVPFGDLEGLERELRAGDVAAFIIEPIQGRMVTLPPEGYLEAAQELCRLHGTLFVIDEIQTGLGRTGRWFALDRWGLEPDVVLVGKALSGGFMPTAAMVTTREIFQRAVGTLERCYVHQSTFGRNRLSMAAGLAAIRVIERDGLLENAARVGALLRDGLTELQERHPIIKEIRADGLMIGIELGPPQSRAARVNWRLVHLASEGLFPQLVVIPLHRDHGVITMAAGKNDVIKLLPPLTLSELEARAFLVALDAVLAECESGRNWALLRGIATATLRRRSRHPGG
jgi:ornithine--oxo-acid transaminase